jgi:hypothetical protein
MIPTCLIVLVDTLLSSNEDSQDLNSSRGAPPRATLALVLATVERHPPQPQPQPQN